MKVLDAIISFLYNVFLLKARILLPVVSIINKKVRLYSKGQKAIPLTLELINQYYKENPEATFVWFHCASLGEFEQGRPLIEAYKSKYPLHKIVLTFFSSSGYEIRKNYKNADYIMYLPIDRISLVNKVVESIKPKLVVFVKYEVWPNLFSALKKHGATIVGISVILREDQMYFKWFGGFFKKALFSFNYIFVQNLNSLNILQKNGFKNAHIAGDTRFDTVLQNKQSVKTIDDLASFTKDRITVVVGSAWQKDMDILIPLINKYSEIKFIIAPHEINQQQIDTWIWGINGNSQKYSGYDATKVDTQVIFIDSVGLLSAAYQYAHYVYIGGSFGKGLHNTLEAAVYGVPIFFGNKAYHKFQEAKDLIEAETAFAVSDFEDLSQKFEELMRNEELVLNISEKSKRYINAQKGATDIILDKI